MALVLWGAGATTTALFKDAQLDRRLRDMEEAKAAFTAVLGELNAYQGKLNTLTVRLKRGMSGVPESTDLGALAHEVQDFVETGKQLSRTMNQATIDLDVSEGKPHQLITERAVLHRTIKDQKSKFDDAQERIASLSERMGQMASELESRHRQTDKLAALREDLKRKVANLTAALRSSKENGSRLIAELDFVKEQLADTKTRYDRLHSEKLSLAGEIKETRADLEEISTRQQAATQRIQSLSEKIASALDMEHLDLARVGDDPELIAGLSRLEHLGEGALSALNQSRLQAKSANTAMKQVMTGLNRVAGFVPTSKNGPKTRPEKALALLEEIEGLHDTQLGLVSRLTEGTLSNIEQAEAMVRATGLDVERMIQLAGLPNGQGGPLVAANLTEIGASELVMNVAVLRSKVERWAVLQNLLACVPLISPVDYYHLSSAFGKRKDPFTGRYAMHKGVDLAGWPGTRVHAAAPGTVTYAGRSSSYGKMVEIDHGCGIKTRYGHLRKVLAKRGQQVSHRAVIGKLGSTGRSTGPHVHYEVRVEGEPVDPKKFIEAGRNVFKTEQSTQQAAVDDADGQ